MVKARPNRQRGDKKRALIVVLCLVFTAGSLLYRNHPESYRLPYSAGKSAKPILAFDHEKDGTIFVSISSYRDSECAGTVEHMFDQADVPERIFVAVCEQNMELPGGEEDCTTGHLPISLRSHVQFIRINSTLAKGPTLGRSLNAGLYNGEDYFLQIDSHTKFIPGWDVELIRMYRRLQSCVKKPVLSTYPVSTDNMESTAVPRICNASYMDNGLYRFEAAHDTWPKGVFVEVPFAAAGFMFVAGNVLKEVPFDPELPYLFMGEELLYSARIWTHGWDIYTPTSNVLFHHYARARKHSVFGDHDDSTWWKAQQQTHAKAMYMLGLSQQQPGHELAANMSRYIMGKERDISTYFDFANIDVPKNKSNSDQKFCGNGPLDHPKNECIARLAEEAQRTQS